MARLFLGIVWVLALWAAPGCELIPPPPAMLTSTAVPDARPAEAPPNMTFSQMPGDWRRLEDDLRRAIKRCHWGTLHVEPPSPPKSTDPAAALRSAPTVTPTVDQPIRMAAMLPDGRPVEILAWRVDGTNLAAGIRVGRFGDEEEERRYLRALTDVLAGPAMFKHRDTFELPDNWPSPSVGD